MGHDHDHHPERGTPARHGRTARNRALGHGVVRASALPDRTRTTRRVEARRRDCGGAVRRRHHQPPRGPIRPSGDPCHRVRTGHLPPGPRPGDLRLAGGRRLRRRVLPAWSDRGVTRQHPGTRAHHRLARHHPRGSRRRSFHHLALGHCGRRRPRLRQRGHRPFRCARGHRRHHRGQPRQPRHPDASA